MGKQWKQWLTIFLGSKITVDSDWSHEIKRRLLLGRKVMTNLGSILKSRDITLPTKFHLVKAMVFLVVVYGYESWTVKKAECRRIDAFELWCWRRLLRVPWTARRSNQSILKEISPGCSLKGLILKLKLLLWPPYVKSCLIGKDPDAGKVWGQEEKGTTEDEMIGWHHRLNGHGFGWTPGVDDGQGGLVCCRFMGSQRVRHDWVTELNWTMSAEVFILMKSNLLIFCLIDSAFGVIYKKYLSHPRHKSYFNMVMVFKPAQNWSLDALFRGNPKSLIYSYFLWNKASSGDLLHSLYQPVELSPRIITSQRPYSIPGYQGKVFSLENYNGGLYGSCLPMI